MEVVHKPHTTLPEAVHTDAGESAPIYYDGPSIPADVSAYPKYHQPPQNHSKPNRFTHWPFLLLLAVLIAAISGLAGGFIGKSITESKAKATPSSTTPALASPTSPTTPSATPTTPAPTNDTPHNSTTFTAQAITGCPAGSGEVLLSDYSRVNFRKFCNINWQGPADLMRILAPTMSDCIEACDNWNRVIGEDLKMCASGEANKCLGAIYAPQLAINRTRALERVGYPSNCFLKNELESNTPDSNGGVEVVGLCLVGNCPQ